MKSRIASRFHSSPSGSREFFAKFDGRLPLALHQEYQERPAPFRESYAGLLTGEPGSFRE
jgi:hypothetical protein